MPFAASIDYAAIAPPLLAVGTALGVLVLDLFVPADRRGVALPVSLAGVVAAMVATGALAAGDDRSTFCTAAGGCSYAVDRFSLLFSGLFLLATAVVLLLSEPTVRAQRLPAGEYHFLLLVSLTGMITLAGSRDLLLLVLSLEVVTVPVFVLAGFRRADPRSSEAALKFFLISVLATAVLIFGASLVYGVTGSLQLDQVAAALARPRLRQPVTSAGIALVIVGFAFKVSAVPFHAWAPDTYQGAPLPVAAFLSVASKAAGFAGLLIVLLVGFRGYADVWGPMLAVIAALTMTVGNLVALRQRYVIRLLAWSSVAQAGYMLVPLGVAASAYGRARVLDDAAAATLGYVVFYAAMTLGAFACVVWVAGDRPRNAVADYRGLARRSPLVALALAFFLACLAGLPPGLAGLFAKVVVFSAAVRGEVVWLGVVMAVNTVVALFYYLRLAALLFAPEDRGSAGVPAVEPPDGPASRPVAVAIAVAVVVTVVLSLDPELVLHITPLAGRG